MAGGQPAAGLYVELRALVAKFQQDMDGAVKTVLGAEKKLTGAFSTIQKVGQAALVIGGVAAVAKLGQALGALAEKGDELDDLTESFKRLGGSSVQLEQAKNAMLGTVSSMDLMKIANEGMIKQIPGLSENFGLMADYAARFAEATGGDATEALKSLTDAFGTAKEKQLAALGVTIDADAAYEKYGKQIGILAKNLDDVQKKEARQLAALEALEGANSRLLPMQDSLNAAQKALGVSMDEGTAKFGAALASNEELTKAYRKFAEVMDDVDWAALGKAAGDFFATVLGWAQSVMPKIIQWTQDATRGFNYLFGSGTQAEADRLAVSITDLKEELGGLDERVKKNPFQGPLGKKLFGWTPEEIEAEKKRLTDAISAGEEKFKGLKTTLDKQNQAASDAAASTNTLTVKVEGLGQAVIPAIKHTGASADALRKQGEEAKKAADEIGKLRDKWNEYLSDSSKDNLKNQLDASIKAQSMNFEPLLEQYKKVVHDGFIAEWQDAINSGAVSLEEVEQEAAKMVDNTAADIRKEWTEAGVDAAKKITDEFAQAFDGLGDVIGSLGDAFGVNLDGVFSTLGKFLSDETKAGITKGIGDALGGMSGEEVNAIFSAASTGINAIAGAKGKDKDTKSNAGTGGAIGAGAGIAIGAAIGGPIGAAIGASIGQAAGEMIGGMFKWGSQNPETKARHAFANFVEESFQKLGQVSFFDAQGKMKNVMGKNFNFVEGDRGRFNDPNWGASMDAWGEKAKGTFLALGEAMKEMQGITEDVGGQIGFLLGENLAGNIDNARLLVQQLGLTFEDMEEALFQAAKKGNMRWSEFQANVAGLQEAFKPGLAAVGDLKGAMDELIGSGGRGVAALKGVRDAAVEAMEKGAKSIEEMGQMMIAQGVDPTLVQDFMAAIRAAGIKTLEDLKNASDRTAGSIVAGLEGNNEGVRKQWEQMTQDLEKLAETIEKIPTEKDVKLNVTTTFDENTQKLMEQQGVSPATQNQNVTPHADGGIVDRPTFFRYGGNKLGVAGEAGAEAILPLTRIGGKLGVIAAGGGKGGATYIVDARGATPGMENRIRQALRDVEERAVKRSINAVADSSRRGGRW